MALYSATPPSGLQASTPLPVIVPRKLVEWYSPSKEQGACDPAVVCVNIGTVRAVREMDKAGCGRVDRTWGRVHLWSDRWGWPAAAVCRRWRGGPPDVRGSVLLLMMFQPESGTGDVEGGAQGIVVPPSGSKTGLLVVLIELDLRRGEWLLVAEHKRPRKPREADDWQRSDVYSGRVSCCCTLTRSQRRRRRCSETGSHRQGEGYSDATS